MFHMNNSKNNTTNTKQKKHHFGLRRKHFLMKNLNHFYAYWFGELLQTSLNFFFIFSVSKMLVAAKHLAAKPGFFRTI